MDAVSTWSFHFASPMQKMDAVITWILTFAAPYARTQRSKPDNDGMHTAKTKIMKMSQETKARNMYETSEFPQ